MIIEHYADQDIVKLRDDVILIYKSLLNETCQCEKCINKLYIEFENWHPEQYENYNDTWKVINILEQSGYPSYDYDLIICSFRVKLHDSLGEVVGEGLNFNQAVCNTLVELGKRKGII